MRAKNNEQEIRNLEYTVIRASFDAGRYIRENSFNIKTVEWKKTDDPVTNLDREAERMIKDYIGQNIHANFYGEEYGISKNGANINVYIDPIDGTKSFLRGEFLSSVSIAADYDKELVIGVVYDFMKDILYYANSKGACMIHGNFSNKTIEQNLENNHEQKLPIKDIKFTKSTITFANNNDKYLKRLEKDLPDGFNSRTSAGSIALVMAQLALGSYDALIMQPFKKNGITDTCDIAAGYYIMKQAGINITDYHLNDYDYKSPSNGIIAINNKTMPIKNLLKKYIAINDISSDYTNQNFSVIQKLYNQELKDIDNFCKAHINDKAKITS